MMYARLKKISDIMETYAEMDFKKPEYHKIVKCEKCNKEFNISIIQKGTANCPDCKSIIRI